jgi:hypothetical protein
MALPTNAGTTGAFSDRKALLGREAPAYQAYQILHVGFTVAPIAFGLDKFFHLMVNWDMYLAPIVSQTLHVNAHAFMLVVGIIEIVAGLLVAFRPRIGGYVVALWLLGIIVNLLMNPIVYDAAHRSWGLDIALRDFGLLLGALALARLAQQFESNSAHTVPDRD